MGVQQQPALVNKPKTTKPMSEARKIRKPLMERKRRERINTCLNDLAALLIDAKMVKTEPGKPAKLEKADILELTVKHIKSFKAPDDSPQQPKAEEENRASSYKDGFTKCMGMVDQTLGKAGKEALRQRLLSHLKNCLKTLDPPTKEPNADSHSSVTATSAEKLESDLAESDVSVASSDSEAEREEEKIDSQSTETSTKETTPRITLVPTRLPSGGVAFVIHGGIDPSLLLPKNDNSVEKTDEKSVSPPPSPATCDSSTSSGVPLLRSDHIPAPSPSSATPPPCAFPAVTTSHIPSPQPSAHPSSHTPSSSSVGQSSTEKPVHPQYPVVHTYHASSPCVPSAVYPEFQCPSSTPYSTLCPATPPAPTYCPPDSPNQEDPSSTNSLHMPATTSYHTLDFHSQPQSIPHHPGFPHQPHDLPTPPPSISPQNIHQVHQYHHHYQPVSSEEDMDTDGLSEVGEEEEVDIDVENDVPYDLSMRRIWRFW
ncbi:protein hairy-like [Macrobrachium nipponense]|uniref:protein hairy-like n=1 Tax=Macrobrachium nipponense TaxID=159736 RepID=UPI0030C7C807